MTFENTKLITHQSCLDGSGCSILYQAFGGKEKNITYSPPGRQADKVIKQICDDFDGEILITDLSVSEDFAEYLNLRGKVALIDHHKTSIGLKKFNWCTIDSANTQCGSKLLYYWITKTTPDSVGIAKYKELVNLIDDYDRWIKKLDKTEDLRYLHHFLGQQRFVKRFVNQPSVLFSNTELQFIKHERDAENDFVEETISRAIIKRENIFGYEYNTAFVLCDDYQNTVAEQLFNNESIDLVVMIGKNRISMRSANHVDVSQIASFNGGGGHKNAGGMQLENVIGESLLDLVV